MAARVRVVVTGGARGGLPRALEEAEELVLRAAGEDLAEPLEPARRTCEGEEEALPPLPPRRSMLEEPAEEVVDSACSQRNGAAEWRWGAEAQMRGAALGEGERGRAQARALGQQQGRRAAMPSDRPPSPPPLPAGAAMPIPCESGHAKDKVGRRPPSSAQTR